MELLSAIAEVIDSHGGNSQHGVGDQFYLDGAGNLLPDLWRKSSFAATRSMPLRTNSAANVWGRGALDISVCTVQIVLYIEYKCNTTR
jgi:hypothetical protein